MAFKVRSTDSRWETRFGRFVSEFGADELAAHLDCKAASVYQWIAGGTSPRIERAVTIQFLAARSGLHLSVSDIYAQRRRTT